MYRIHEIKLKIDEDVNRIPAKVAEKLKLKSSDIKKWKIARESVDARDKGNIRLVYSVDFEC